MQQATLSRWSAGLAPGEAFAREVARALARDLRLAPEAVEVRYRRYTTLKSTARVAPDGRLVVCLSDDARAAPPEAQAAIAFVLGARVLGRRAPAWAEACYAAWLADPATRELALRVRAQRARRRTRSARGLYHDLKPLIDELCRTLFSPPIAAPPVAWTERSGRAVLASFDEAHGLITVSRLLDHRRVEADTVRYLLYHELLHFQDFRSERAQGRAGAPTRRARRRRSVHPKSFVDRLHQFPGWRQAEKDLARALRRRKVD